MALLVKNLREFIRLLKREGELVEIETPVSRDLEISEIYFRHARSVGGGKALLFTNVEGSKFPVLINALGSFDRVRLGFGGRTPDDLAADMASLLSILKMRGPGSAGEAISWAGHLRRALRFPPKRPWRLGRAPCQQVVLTGGDIDLDMLPIIKSWPEDGGRFITFGMTVTRSLDGASNNLGLYRLQVLDQKNAAMHWQIHKDGSHFWNEYRKAGQRMPVAVVIGADPAVMYSSLAPMPPRISEFLLAGFIRGSGVPLVKCITHDLEVPAEAEIILEGFVDPDDLTDEGPFGDHTGYYTPIEKFPIFHLTAITMRKAPVFSATVVGRSPQEDCYLAWATERIFLPLLKLVAPEVQDQMLPWDGCFHNGAVFSIEKSFPYQARRLMSHLWGFSQMSFAKSIVVVDGGVPLKQDRTLLDHILNTIDIERDVYISDGILDQLDHSGMRALLGGKVGIDATTMLEGESSRAAPRHASAPSAGIKSFLGRLRKAGISISGHRLYGGHLVNPVLFISCVRKSGSKKRILDEVTAVVARHGKDCPANVVLILDSADEIENDSYVLWKLYGNVDPIRDIRKIGSPPILVADAGPKGKVDGYDREWPKPNVMSDEIIRLVDKKWPLMFGVPAFDVERP